MTQPVAADNLPPPEAQPALPGAAWLRAAVEHHQAELLLYAGRLLHDEHKARDAVQEVFLRLCGQEPASLDGHLKPWLLTVCRRHCLDLRRKDARMTATPTSTLDQSMGRPADPSAAAESRDDQSRMLHELEKLPGDQQEAVRLKFQFDLSYKEIAAVMETTTGTVGWLIHAGLKTMRERMT